MEYSPSQH